MIYHIQPLDTPNSRHTSSHSLLPSQVSMLRHPQTLYVLMTRDYAEMLWSSYNFWCRAKHDGFASCDQSRWIDPAKHVRSPELFHEVARHPSASDPSLD